MIDKYQLTDVLRRIAREHLQKTINKEEIAQARVEITETARLEFCVKASDPTQEAPRYFYVKVSEPL